MLTTLAREEDETGLVGFETGDVESERFFTGGAAAVVDADADGAGEGAGDACFL